MGGDGDAPLVSVIVSTYNWSSVLRYALLSVQGQTMPDFEVLVIGDGCTDDSEQVVASLGDMRFRWDNLPVNHGHQSAANNRGLALARGEWIAYLGHDDLWMPNHLQLLLGRLKETGCDVAFSLAMAIGAPGCDGRMLFGLFENGEYRRGCDLPPSALIHRRSLSEKFGNWPDHRVTIGSPESALLARFFDSGARFASIANVTVLKFPSSWRPGSYLDRRCDEQAEFFQRMQTEPDFLCRELTELAIANQLLKPHTTVRAAPGENDLLPGAVIEEFRRNRGLTSETPQQGPPRYVPSPELARLVAQLAVDHARNRQLSRWAIFELFYPVNGTYSAAFSTRTLIPVGRWTRMRIPLKHCPSGAPLRIDPCERPAVIEVAWIALRRDGRVKWSARGPSLDAVKVGGDAVPVNVERVLKMRSRGNDPMFFLPADAEYELPLSFDCWLRISAADS